MIVLNVGAGDSPIPAKYDGWEHKTLDVDPRWNPDILLDAREMKTLPADTYDAVYSSHFIEHIHRHELTSVLEGFLHVLKPGGEASIRVPDLQVVAEQMANGLDLTDTLYQVPAGNITLVDMVYGYWKFIEESENEFMCHRNGFTQLSLAETLYRAGFENVEVARRPMTFELWALAHKKK